MHNNTPPKALAATFPLSLHQERVLFIDQFETGNVYPGHPTYHNIPLIEKISGVVDSVVLSQALNQAANRHEVFRTRFNLASRQQEILQTGTIILLIEDIAAPASEDEALEHCLVFVSQEFELDNVPLRCKLFRFDGGCYLVTVMHHLIADRQTLSIYRRQLWQDYQNILGGRLSCIPEPELHYADFSEWQHQLPEDLLDSQFLYWQYALKDKPKVLDIPTDVSRHGMHIFCAGQELQSVSAQTLVLLRKLADRYQCQLETLIHTAFFVLLHKYSGQEQVCFGLDLAMRDEDAQVQMTGPVSNLAVLLYDISNGTLADNLSAVNDLYQSALENKEIPFDLLVQRLKPEKDMSRTALFDVLLSLDLQGYPVIQDNGLSIDVIETNLGYGKYDFHLLVQYQPEDDSLSANLVYNKELYQPYFAKQFVQHFVRILNALTQNPVQNARQIALMDVTETQLQQALGCQYLVSYPVELNAVAQFSKIAQIHAGRVAVTCGSQSISYAELDAQSNMLAHYLLQHVPRDSELIGVSLKASVEAVLAIMAVLKAGFGYLPLDPDLPEDRRNFILDDACCGMLIVQKDASPSAQIPLLDIDSGGWRVMPESLPEVQIAQHSLAYCIYTSGSTGKPKGVLVEHRNLIRLFINDSPLFQFDEHDVWTVFHSLNFDFSVWELFGALLFGGRAVIVEKALKHDPASFLDLLHRESVTVLSQTPSAFYNLSRTYQQRVVLDLQLRYVVFGGEALNPMRVDAWHQRHSDTLFVNMYGITETTVHVSYKVLSPSEMRSSTSVIGRPIPTTSWYILDDQMRPVPTGLPGELYIGGDGVTRGYLNRPGLNAERFIPNPFGAGRLYRSGDKARYLPDGDVEYLGRLDNQIQLRGFRIELGEIHAQLLQLDGIQDAAVVLAEAGNGERYIVAYLVTLAKLDPHSLRTQLIRHIPEYMLPSIYVELDSLPTTSNGKLDVAQLPDPADWRKSGEEYVAPSGDTEKALADIWCSTMKLQKVGANDNFFGLGGHSLLATNIIAAIRHQLAVEVPIRTFFENPSIALLANWIAQQSDRVDSNEAVLVPTCINQDAPLSFQQQRLWLIDQIGRGSSQYNMVVAFELRGEIKEDAMERALCYLIERHSVLRTRFEDKAGQQVQSVLMQSGFMLVVRDFSDLSNETQRVQVEDTIAQQYSYCFDLKVGCLIKAHMLRLGRDHRVLVLNIHHIASDGWSMSLLAKELASCYQYIVQQGQPPQWDSPLQYIDYAVWQQQEINRAIARQKTYWMQQLADVPLVHSLPLDFTRPRYAQFEGGKVQADIPMYLAGALLDLANRQQVTPFMLLHAAFSLLLANHSESHDIVLGTPVANRQRGDLAGAVGFFANTLVLRTHCDSNLSFAGYLQQVRQVNLEAQAHQEMPFEALVDALKVPRTSRYSPLFQILFSMNTNEQVSLDIPGLEINPVNSPIVNTKFDLMLDADLGQSGGKLHWIYDKRLFKHGTIEALNQRLIVLLEAVVHDSDTPLWSVPVLPDEDADRMLYKLNELQLPTGVAQSIHGRFAEVAFNFSDRVAVACEDQSLTYGQLQQHAQALALHLQLHGVGPGSLVGIALDRGGEAIISLLAVLCTGGAYVPLDPCYPQARLDYIVRDSGLSLLITRSDIQDQFVAFELQHVLIDTLEFSVSQSSSILSGSQGGEDSAYVIYTSGSTGEPKGVVQTHSNVMRLFSATDPQFGFNEQDVWTQFHSISFDFSVWEIWGALLHGGTLVIPSHRQVRDPGLFWQLCRKQSVSVLNQTPRAFLSFAQECLRHNDKLESLRYIIFGGEALQSETLAPWWHAYGDDSPKLINMYGITETTVHVTYKVLTQSDIGSSNIGRRLADQAIYLLDKGLKPVPPGVVGEIYVGGAGLATAYLHKNSLTQQRFMNNPYATEEMCQRGWHRLYKSGDLARFDEHGELHYIGRNDLQVKVRGYRIELGEIENALNQHPMVNSCLVLVDDANEQQTLVAYAQTEKIADEDKQAVTGQLRQWLQDILPQHMCPNVIRLIDTWPLTVNGKIDRAALPEPIVPALHAYQAPVTEVEKRLVAIWSALLGLPENGISVTANFFELGGNSLLVIRLLNHVEEQFGIRLDVRSLFDIRELRDLAGLLQVLQVSQGTLSEESEWETMEI